MNSNFETKDGAAVGDLLLKVVRKHITMRATVVVAITHALRAALDALSPDERTSALRDVVEFLQ